MKSDFLITSKNQLKEGQPVDLNQISVSNNIQFFAKIEVVKTFGEIKVLIDGYVLPRNELNTEYKNLSQYEMISILYRKYGNNLTEFIKGIFCIVIVDHETIKVFNDHLGISKFFYSINQNLFCVSNSFKRITDISGNHDLNCNTLAIKTLLNREINGETLFSKTYYSQPATILTFPQNNPQIETYWKHDTLLKKDKGETDFSIFASLFRQNIQVYNHFLHPPENAITLTGGKDSRTTLAALLSEGIKPLGMTYGDPLSRDAVYAKTLAAHAGIRHEIINPPKTVEWFDATADEIIALDNPLINIHRSHRFFAMKRLAELQGENAAYYTGYMGGELLMGVYYDNLIFTDFLTNTWENDSHHFGNVPNILEKNFIKPEVVDIPDIKDKLLKLKTFDDSASKRVRQFHGLFEIGMLHHSQDLQIAIHILDYPIPLFLDIDFLEALFSSYFSFLFHDNKSRNLLKRYALFKFNLNVQHILYPGLDCVPFAKRGSYNTKEFLRGSLFWAVLKTVRYLIERKKYPATFSYNKAYRSFLKKWLNEIIADKNSPINGIYDVVNALIVLERQPGLTMESPLHRYSNIVMHYLQYKHYTKK